MDFIYLLFACLFFSVQSVFQKFFQKNTKRGFRITIWNQFVMYVCMTLWLSVTSGFLREFSSTSLIYAILYTAVGLAASVSALFAMGYGKISVVSMFSLLGGMVLPFFYGLIILGEKITIWKIFGILVLICAMLPPVLTSEDDGKNSKNKGKFITFCLLVFFGNGMTSVFSKAHQISPNAVETDSFVLLCALVSMLSTAIILLSQTVIFAKKGEKSPVRQIFYEIGRKPMTGKLFVFLIALLACYALCNGLGNIASLRCALTMDSSIQFPLLSSVVIIMAAILGRVIFKEKITRANQISLILTLVGIGLFMIPSN